MKIHYKLSIDPLLVEIHHTIVISAWRHAFTLLGEKYFAFFSAPASLALLGKTQTHRADDSLPKAQENFRKEQTVSEKNAKYYNSIIILTKLWYLPIPLNLFEISLIHPIPKPISITTFHHTISLAKIHHPS